MSVVKAGTAPRSSPAMPPGRGARKTFGRAPTSSGEHGSAESAALAMPNRSAIENAIKIAVGIAAMPTGRDRGDSKGRRHDRQRQFGRGDEDNRRRCGFDDGDGRRQHDDRGRRRGGDQYFGRGQQIYRWRRLGQMRRPRRHPARGPVQRRPDGDRRGRPICDRRRRRIGRDRSIRGKDPRRAPPAIAIPTPIRAAAPPADADGSRPAPAAPAIDRVIVSAPSEPAPAPAAPIPAGMAATPTMPAAVMMPAPAMRRRPGGSDEGESEQGGKQQSGPAIFSSHAWQSSGIRRSGHELKKRQALGCGIGGLWGIGDLPSANPRYSELPQWRNCR